MTLEDRNTILETVDILRALGGNNGFSNLQPKFKRTLLKYAGNLKAIVEKDTKFGESMKTEEFTGETVYD